jgi:hypothetical protein
MVDGACKMKACTSLFMLGGLPAAETGDTPIAMAVGDLNGDGKSDIVTANSYDDSVSVLLGKGNGTFAPTVDYPASATPAAIAVGDFDGNGKLDLVVANEGANTVSVRMGRGDGTFLGNVDYATGSGPTSVVAADLNGDGRLDLAAQNNEAATVSVLFGKGNGTFSAKVDYPVEDWPNAMAVGDLNGDGRLDVVVACESTDSGLLRVLLGKSDGTFTAKPARGMDSSSITAMIISDLNGDGVLDLAMADKGGRYSNSKAFILYGNGDGTFSSEVDLLDTGGVKSIVARDLNGDGKPYLAVSRDAMVSLYFAQANGTWSSPVDYPMQAGVAGWSGVGGSFLFSDFNGDGKVDLAGADTLTNSVIVRLGKGDGTFATLMNYPTGDQPYSVFLRDLDGDGKPDVLTANQDTDSVSVLFGKGQGAFGAHTTYPAGKGPYFLDVGDLNGDSQLDLVMNSGNVLLAAGNGTYAGQGAFYAKAISPTLALEDLDGDGKPDLVTLNNDDDPRSVNVLLGKGDGMFSKVMTYPLLAYTSALSLKDLDCDGKLDLVVGGYHGISVFLGEGGGAFGARQDYPSDTNSVSLVLPDLNGDGVVDIVASNNDHSGVSVLLGKGDGTFAANVDYAFWGWFDGRTIQVGDLNGDGKPDVAVAEASTGLVSVLVGAGDGTFACTLLFDGGYGHGLALGDLNGDKRTDAVTSSYDGRAVNVLLNAPF